MWPSPGSLGTTTKAVSKTHLFRCLTTMFIQEMSVDFANENATVLVTEPGSDGHEIDPGHHANRTKIMAQIMETDPFETGGFARDL